MTELESLWGSEFTLENNDKKTKKIISKIANPKDLQVVVEKQIKSKKLSVHDRLSLINENVLKTLSQFKDNVLVIKSKEQLTDYFTKAIKNGEITVDTETNNSLDPLTCKLLGPCFYTKGEKQVYVPLNHINHETNERLDWQLTEKDVRDEFLRLKDTKIIMHNAKFDIQVIKCTCDVELNVYWDTMIAARLIDENERSASLKNQYIDKIDANQEKYSIDHLFENVMYEWVDPEIFSLYAATDAFMTYQLYQWQDRFFRDNPDTKDVLKLFLTLENPLVKVTADMELKGIELDLSYTEKLSKKYHEKLKTVNEEITKELEKYSSVINAWKKSTEGSKLAGKLSEPINFGSPTQLAILLYDILKIKSVDKLKPRGTGEEILNLITEQNNIPLCNLILELRGITKLIDTYVDKLPTLLNKKDSRLHCYFNQLGTDTGRFSSSEPNMQNIPSQNREIRLMFKARDGYMFVGGDFASQEPRLTAHYSQDENMLKAYEEDKDLYSVIAQSMYNNKYEDNLEYYPKETRLIIDGKEVVTGFKTHQNKTGKERRSQAKIVLLGLLYGRGPKAIGEQINKSVKEGQEIIDRFYKSFPKVKKWIENVNNKVRKVGYVEDFYGRRRRLPDIMLAPYVVEVTKKNEGEVSLENFNPFLDCENKSDSEKLIQDYLDMTKKIRSYKDYEEIKTMAENEGISIQANTNKIAQAERQSVNAIVQGGAATLTKIAMINIFKDEELKRLGFKMLLTVHDELMGECPKENAEEVAERLSKVMADSAKPYMKVQMKCDTYVVSHWYADEMTSSLQSEFKKLLSNMSDKDAFKKLCDNHTELDIENLTKVIYKNEVVM